MEKGVTIGESHAGEKFPQILVILFLNRRRFDSFDFGYLIKVRELQRNVDFPL